MKSEDLFEIYTDGSCNNLKYPNFGGWAYVILENGAIIESKSGNASHTTNNIMELTAIINAVSILPYGSRATVYTDSEYCIGCLTGRYKPKANVELIGSYFKIAEECQLDVCFRWVKGHSGNKYNEMVDNMANAEYIKVSGEELPDFGRLKTDNAYRKSFFSESKESVRLKALWEFVSGIISDDCPKGEAYIQNKVNELRNIIRLTEPKTRKK